MSLFESGIKLSRFVSHAAGMSRRKAMACIHDGRVRVNNQPVGDWPRVHHGDSVSLDGHDLTWPLRFDYIVYNKPPGIICTNQTTVKNNILTHLNLTSFVSPIGRLDKASQGLLLLTNDGQLSQRLTHPNFFHEKCYRVAVDQTIPNWFIREMSSGVRLSNTTTRPCLVETMSETEFSITLTQGLNRQIRRMCAHFGFKVLRLERTRVMNLSLGNLPLDCWRHLTEEEKRLLMP